ncbi:MAG: helix-turn-helix domain-containing protein [Bacteroidota bacterium]
MEQPHIQFIRPHHPALKEYIKGYYVHQSLSKDFRQDISFFQNHTTCISIYHDSRYESTGRRRKMYAAPGTGFLSLLVGNVQGYQEVQFFGPVNRLAIVFHSLGLNHFMRDPLGQFIQPHFGVFPYFKFAFQDALPAIFREADLTKKRDLLDTFFWNQYVPFPDQRLTKVIQTIQQSADIPQVQALADSVAISRRTLLRLFRKHLSYSIEEYLSVVRFRRALLQFQEQKNESSFLNLAQIAYESGYYDQPDFNRQLKERSGFSPKDLFNQLTIMDDVLFWKPLNS